MKCKDCKYWNETGGHTKLEKYSLGFCRRFPPTPQPEKEMDGFAVVGEEDWCGEFKEEDGN